MPIPRAMNARSLPAGRAQVTIRNLCEAFVSFLWHYVLSYIQSNGANNLQTESNKRL